MPMPPALAAAIAAKSGKKKSKTFQKVASDSTAPTGPGDPNKGFAKAAQAKLAAQPSKGKKKGAVPPQFR